MTEFSIQSPDKWRYKRTNLKSRSVPLFFQEDGHDENVPGLPKGKESELPKIIERMSVFHDDMKDEICSIYEHLYLTGQNEVAKKWLHELAVDYKKNKKGECCQ